MIIKNCPSFDSGHNGCASHKTTSADCKKVKNCIMKQIVNGCIAHIEAREILFADKILNILEVER
jgi:hypothetical protein